MAPEEVIETRAVSPGTNPCFDAKLTKILARELKLIVVTGSIRSVVVSLRVTDCVKLIESPTTGLPAAETPTIPPFT